MNPLNQFPQNNPALRSMDILPGMENQVIIILHIHC